MIKWKIGTTEKSIIDVVVMLPFILFGIVIGKIWEGIVAGWFIARNFPEGD